MLDDLKTFLPAAGLASRMQGIPKFLLPLYKEKTLLGFHLDNLLELKNNEVVIGTSPQFYNNLTNIYSEQNILEIESKSMVETVVKLDLDQNRTSLVVMPDTYFSDYEIVNQMRKKLSSTDLDVVLGLWKIKNDQKGKLGQCRIEGELIKKIIGIDIFFLNLTLGMGSFKFNPLFVFLLILFISLSKEEFNKMFPEKQKS